jgi:hypothetical protein
LVVREGGFRRAKASGTGRRHRRLVGNLGWTERRFAVFFPDSGNFERRRVRSGLSPPPTSQGPSKAKGPSFLERPRHAGYSPISSFSGRRSKPYWGPDRPAMSRLSLSASLRCTFCACRITNIDGHCNEDGTLPRPGCYSLSRSAVEAKHSTLRRPIHRQRYGGQQALDAHLDRLFPVSGLAFSHSRNQNRTVVESDRSTDVREVRNEEARAARCRPLARKAMAGLSHYPRQKST